MKKYNKNNNSKVFWEKRSKDYSKELNNAYHKNRLAAIHEIIPEKLYAREQQVFEFGCGDAVIFPKFLQAGANIKGIDISNEMITLARNRLESEGFDAESSVIVGDVNYLNQINSASLDGLLSLNTVAYLSDEEEQTFYQEASRIVKQGGYLIVSHSNELFDMFSLNRYTAEFFKKYLLSETSYNDQIESLLSAANTPENFSTFNIRENPLTYKYKLRKYGFRETRQEFSHLHEAPPSLLKNKSFPNTLGHCEEEKWKFMFCCSTYLSCSIRT